LYSKLYKLKPFLKKKKTRFSSSTEGQVPVGIGKMGKIRRKFIKRFKKIGEDDLF